MSSARHAVGIDLGTTHCALSWIDADNSEGERVAQHQLAIPQLTAPGTLEAGALLPAFLYLPHRDELDPGALALPWSAAPSPIAGALARTLGLTTPIRLVASAKSWLCHPEVDREAPILPIEAPAEVERISPLAATMQYLAHLRAAWDSAHPQDPLAAQALTITVPASFDPAARELTAAAARAVGLDDFTLLEEPQAALYSWIAASAGGWREQVTIGDLILVIDVGGGTTDLSLIAVDAREGALELTRVAVGEHILLGGDNMDLALAHRLRAKLAAAGVELDRWQLQQLTHGCRDAKEALFADPALERLPVVLASRGARLVGASIRTELTRAELEETLVEGFFPEVAADSRPQTRARAALTRVGLPYAQDPAITRHLAAFLTRHHETGATAAALARPTAVLFNGGVFKAEALRERVMAVLAAWLAPSGAPPPRQLTATDLDLAVARGAAFHAHARRHGGVRIRGGTSHAYYVGVEGAAPAVPGIEPELAALCLVPLGLEEGSPAVAPDQEFGLVVGEPVRFRFFGADLRRDDRVGDLLEEWSQDELSELEEVQVTLTAHRHRPGEVVAVRLQAAVTETGTLELIALPSDGGEERWAVAFDTRGRQPTR
ncbi:Hsp70 family protein [Marichromatium gracile]|uniref:Molecular chaperone DnaK n=1 Tax=Marichromatium gracile TaxID=1048 RepID=A0ABR5VJT7_MARGR|nr:Hsp70 family protein [Marichromatium gracile]KXX65842.1 molecular chaperone DnaK [Marichromatium gracile]